MENIFNKISEYWSAELNNAIYFKGENVQLERGSKAYFAYIIQHRTTYFYYFPEILAYFQIHQVLTQQPKLLEVGCGMGTDLLQLAQLGYQCYGIDLADNHITLARQLFRLHNTSATIQKDNAEQLEFPDEYFDAVYSFGVIHHTQNPQNAIRELWRVMKPEGRGIVMLYHKYSLNNLMHTVFRIPYENVRGHNPVAKDAHFVYRYSRQEVTKMFAEFRDVHVKTAYLFGAGWGTVYNWIPRCIYRFFSSFFGWHLLVFFKK